MNTFSPAGPVLQGRDEIGRTDPALLTEYVDGPRLLLLAGQSWRVSWIDWKLRRCFVEPADSGGKAGWIGYDVGFVSYALARAARDVLLGTDPPVTLTRRAVSGLADIREDMDFTVHPGGPVICRAPSGDLRWWTWAGHRTNATLKATLGSLVDQKQRISGEYVRLRGDLRPDGWRSALAELDGRLVLPEVDQRALNGLKFSAALPEHLAEATLSARLADLEHAEAVLAERHRFVNIAT